MYTHMTLDHNLYHTLEYGLYVQNADILNIKKWAI